MQYDHARISRLSKRLIDGIQSQVEQVIRNGDDQNTYPGTALFLC
jgi:cysteine desulfurase